MKRILKISQILVYYDGPELFIAYDEVGTNYICLLVELEDDSFTHICTPISHARLLMFLNGGVELRKIFENPERKEFFITHELDDTFETEFYNVANLPEAFLPEEGFCFSSPLVEKDDIIDEIIRVQNTVVHLTTSDKEGEPSIDIENFGDILKLYQLVIKYCYKKLLSQNPSRVNKIHSTQNSYKLRAFAYSPGSFNLHLYATSHDDLFGNAMLDLSLRKFDEVCSDFMNKEDCITSLRSVKGHTLGSLKKLLKKLIDSNIRINHKWATPSEKIIHKTLLDKIKAEKIYEILMESNELVEETKTFIGCIVQTDVERGTWRVRNDEDGLEYNGDSDGNILKGVIMDTNKYKLICQEIIEEMKVTEKENTKYLLQRIELVN